MTWLDGVTDLMGISLSKLWELVTDMEAWRAAIPGVSKNPRNAKLLGVPKIKLR